MRIIGIDNGLSGGIAWYDGAEIHAVVMPVFGKGKQEYDLPAIHAQLDFLGSAQVFIEHAQAMPGQGVSSMFTIGKNYGLMIGIVSSLGLPYTIVNPRTWQKEMFKGVPKKDTKAASYTVCSRTWPRHDWRATPKSRTPHDGMTDAACIALYGWRSLGGVEDMEF